jgi:hypothetical protein
MGWEFRTVRCLTHQLSQQQGEAWAELAQLGAAGWQAVSMQAYAGGDYMLVLLQRPPKSVWDGALRRGGYLPPLEVK